MNLAIMQPYIFPYIGYFELIGAVDRFVIYDDVAYIKRGWVNRNKWLVKNAPAYFTIPVQNASQNHQIAHTRVMPDDGWQAKLLKTFRQNYGKAPYYCKAEQLLEQVVTLEHAGIAQRAVVSLRMVAEYLGLTTSFVETSQVYDNAHMKASERIIDICRQERTAMYVNAIGGQELYEPSAFESFGIKLRFLRPRPITYKQFTEPFVASLSILDVIAFNSPEVIREMLHEYDLV